MYVCMYLHTYIIFSCIQYNIYNFKNNINIKKNNRNFELLTK